MQFKNNMKRLVQYTAFVLGANFLPICIECGGLCWNVFFSSEFPYEKEIRQIAPIPAVIFTVIKSKKNFKEILAMWQWILS